MNLLRGIVTLETRGPERRVDCPTAEDAYLRQHWLVPAELGTAKEGDIVELVWQAGFFGGEGGRWVVNRVLQRALPAPPPDQFTIASLPRPRRKP